MPTYNGWTIVPMPTTPAAPAEIEFTKVDANGVSVSPFTGQQQVQSWGATWRKGRCSFPPLTHAQALAWVTFLESLNGMANVFQFSPAFTAAYAESLGTRYWRLANNEVSWSVSRARHFGIEFEFLEAL